IGGGGGGGLLMDGRSAAAAEAAQEHRAIKLAERIFMRSCLVMRLSLHREENGLSTARFDKERSLRLNDSVRNSSRSTSSAELSGPLKCFVGSCDKSATVKGWRRAPRRACHLFEART